MAEEHDKSQQTEEPTQRRLDEAHKKGDVVKSAELSSFVLLSGGTLALVALSTMAARTFIADFTVFLEQPEQLPLGAGRRLRDLLQHAMLGLLAVVGPAVGLHGRRRARRKSRSSTARFSRPRRLKPDLSKLSLLKGAKRLFGLDGIINLVKGLLKMADGRPPPPVLVAVARTRPHGVELRHGCRGHRVADDGLGGQGLPSPR